MTQFPAILVECVHTSFVGHAISFGGEFSPIGRLFLVFSNWKKLSIFFSWVFYLPKFEYVCVCVCVCGGVFFIF